jgi:hypothetical protein
MPDAADSYWEVSRAQEGIKIGIAMVIVFFPAYLTMTRIVNKNRRQSSDHAYLGLTKWLIYLSLLVGGAVLLGDLVAVIMSFLEGDITSRFLLKAGAILIVVGAAFHYYLHDVKGHWMTNEGKSKVFALVVSLIVTAVVIAGFTQVQSPSEAREMKIDQEQISDLQNIQWQIEEYLAVNEALPESLNKLSNTKLPETPDGRTDYTYTTTETGFNLCATFNQASQNDNNYYGRPYPGDGDLPVIVNSNHWEHDGGEVCFDRVVK